MHSPTPGPNTESSKQSSAGAGMASVIENSERAGKGVCRSVGALKRAPAAGWQSPDTKQ